MTHECRGLGRMAALACATLGLAAPPVHASGYAFQDGVSLSFASQGSAIPVYIGAPSGGKAFQGIGVNLGAMSDMIDIPCAKGSVGCTVAPPPGAPVISAKSVRTSINLPFTAKGTSYVDSTGTCQVMNVGKYVVYNNPAGSLAFFDKWGATPFYGDTTCGVGDPDPNASVPTTMPAKFGTSGACTDPGSFQAACLMDGVRTRGLDWVQVFFASPAEFLTACGSGCDRLKTDTTSMQNFAMFKAAQLVYQGRFGNAPAAPRYVELFNEPEGTWNVQVAPGDYDNFVGLFASAMQQLVAQRLQTAGLSAGEKAYLHDLSSVQLVGPALGASYLLDYRTDTSIGHASDPGWDVSGDWFRVEGDARAFYQTLSGQGGLVSTHTYDDKRTGMGDLDVLTGMQQLIDVRNVYSPASPVLISEAAETVQNDVEGSSYKTYCTSTNPLDPNKKSTEGACGAPYPGDPQSIGFSYPDCIANPVYNGKANGYTGTPIADFCHHQAVKLYRNLTNFANQNDQHSSTVNGVVSELIWVSSPSKTSSEHGLITRKGLPSLMNVGTDRLLSNFATDGYDTVFPATFQADDDLGVGVFAAGAAKPQAARLALANTSMASKTVALNFTGTPMAAFKTVSAGVAFGGTSDKYTGTTEAMSGAVIAPSNFGNPNSMLIVTLPANSAVTLTLAP